MSPTGLDARTPGVDNDAGTGATARPREHPHRVPPLPAGQQSCCCPARAFVRVRVPPDRTRPEPTDLYLCAHHFRAGRTALTSVGAVAFDGAGAQMTSSSPVFLPCETRGRAGQPAPPEPRGVAAR